MTDRLCETEEVNGSTHCLLLDRACPVSLVHMGTLGSRKNKRKTQLHLEIYLFIQGRQGWQYSCLSVCIFLISSHHYSCYSHLYQPVNPAIHDEIHSCCFYDGASLCVCAAYSQEGKDIVSKKPTNYLCVHVFCV